MQGWDVKQDCSRDIYKNFLKNYEQVERVKSNGVKTPGKKGPSQNLHQEFQTADLEQPQHPFQHWS